LWDFGAGRFQEDDELMVIGEKNWGGVSRAGI